MLSLSKLDLADPSDDYFKYPKNEEENDREETNSGNIDGNASASCVQRSAYSVFKENKAKGDEIKYCHC